MRRILVLVFVLLSIQGFAQPSNYSWYKQRTRQYSFMADSAMYLPRYNGTPSGVRSNESSTISGMVGIDTTNHRQYFRSGSSWRRLANYTELGVDSIWRVAGKDSIFWSKQGTTYKIKDSTGGGTPTLQQVMATEGNVSVLTSTSDISPSSGSYDFYIGDDLRWRDIEIRSDRKIELNNLFSLISIRDSIMVNPYNGIANIDSLRTWSGVSDTTYKKPMTWDTRNGRWEYAANWYGGGSGASGGGITVGTTTITSGTSGRIAYNNAGVYGEKAVTGTGDVVLATSPSITTPVIVTSYTLNDGATKATFATNFYGMDISSKSVRFNSSGNTYLKYTSNDESATDPAVTVNTIVTGKPGIKILLTGSQTADAFYVENSGGNKLVDITANGVLDLYNYGTAPTASVTNGIRLYAEDVSSSAELKVRDEAGNITTLSPHNFSKIPGGKSEEMAWSFYSEKDGQYINVDMLKLARLLEKLTGEKLVYTGKK